MSVVRMRQMFWSSKGYPYPPTLAWLKRCLPRSDGGRTQFSGQKETSLGKGIKARTCGKKPQGCPEWCRKPNHERCPRSVTGERIRTAEDFEWVCHECVEMVVGRGMDQRIKDRENRLLPRGVRCASCVDREAYQRSREELEARA